MERLKHIKSTLESLVETQLGDIEHTCTAELGEVIDMIKDLEKAMYYCAIVEAMEKSGEEPEMRHMGFTERWPHGEYDWDEKEWRPYYYYQTSGRGSGNQYGGMNSSTPGSTSQGGSSGSGHTSYYGGPNYYYSDGEAKVGHDLKEVSKYLTDLNKELPHMMEKATVEDKKKISEQLQEIQMKATVK